MTKQARECYIRNSYNRWQYWLRVIKDQSWWLNSVTEEEAIEIAQEHEIVYYRHQRDVRSEG